MNNVGGEPAGGDFVAFLEHLQKRQLHALGTTPHRPPTSSAPKFTKEQAAAIAEALLPERRARLVRSLPPAVFMGLAGGASLGIGLWDGFSLLPMALGAGLLWQAWRRARNIGR